MVDRRNWLRLLHYSLKSQHWIFPIACLCEEVPKDDHLGCGICSYCIQRLLFLRRHIPMPPYFVLLEPIRWPSRREVRQQPHGGRVNICSQLAERCC